MKSIYYVGLFFFVAIFNLNAQQGKYQEAMKKSISELNEAKDIEALLTAANSFERISKVADKEWLPLYYQSFAQMQAAAGFMGSKQMDKCMQSVEKAQAVLKTALELAPNEAELYIMQAYVYQGYIWEDVQANGAKFTPMIFGVLERAIAMDADNPRAYLMKGQQTYFMPEFFGGGAKTALPLLEQAEEKYSKYTPASELHPNWGKDRAKALLAQARENN